MSDVSVRRVGPDDWETWREVRLAALADSPEVFPGELALAQDYDETAWRERLDESYGVWLLATSDTAEPIGQVGAWLPFGSVPTLVQTWVRPVWRGRGVGDALIEEALGWTRERGHDRLDLWVLETNLPARRLYERHGFFRTAEYLPCPDLPRMREERMVRRLTRS
ncbi:MAG TPA: GNAT family N-acetyltransferase [Micromonosporaceae bacterium]|jgi:GNAT superfamily N-acetyltransferase|nr:GNAT family N-acetyltransferase [Micromonosporaceae bacterium]